MPKRLIPKNIKKELKKSIKRGGGQLAQSTTKEKQNLKCVFHEDLRDIDRSVDIMCLWFFRERTDRAAGNDVKLAGKIINYSANTILITPSKEIKIKERKKYFPRRPCVQIYISMEIYLNTKKDLKINE